MAVNRDFKDLFAEFNAGRVKYLLVGGYAMAVYGLPRFTKDLDLWVEPTLANAKRVIVALTAFGAPLYGLDPISLVHADLMCQIGVAPNRIDVLTRIDGVTFKAAWPKRGRTTYGDERVNVISRRDLIKNKRASGRPQDLLDVKQLLEADK